MKSAVPQGAHPFVVLDEVIDRSLLFEFLHRIPKSLTMTTSFREMQWDRKAFGLLDQIAASRPLAGAERGRAPGSPALLSSTISRGRSFRSRCGRVAERPEAVPFHPSVCGLRKNLMKKRRISHRTVEQRSIYRRALLQGTHEFGPRVYSARIVELAW
jgi:hypothetical protein